MVERARRKLECGESEPDAGAMLSLVPLGSWPALALLPGISPPGAPMESMDQSEADPPWDHTPGSEAPGDEQAGGKTEVAGPEAPACPGTANSGAWSEPMAGTEARSRAHDHAPLRQADAWARVAVRAKRGRFPAAVRAVAEQMLIEGASPEEVVQAAHDRGLLRLKRSTVQRWLDTNPGLREQAVRRQAETAEALRKSLAADLGSPEARLAEAALFAGLSRPLRRSSRLGPEGRAALDVSMRKQLEQENRLLRRQAERLERRKQSITRRIIRARLRLERMRWSLFQRHVSRMYSAIKREGRREALAPQLLEGLRSLRRLARGGRRKRGDREAG
jgi:hypothetical protein